MNDNKEIFKLNSNDLELIFDKIIYELIKLKGKQANRWHEYKSYHHNIKSLNHMLILVLIQDKHKIKSDNK